MAVWKGYCGTGGKPVGNRENKHDPNQSEKPIYSTICDQALVSMNEPAEGELALILERQICCGLPMTLYMCLAQNLSVK